MLEDDRYRIAMTSPSPSRADPYRQAWQRVERPATSALACLLLLGFVLALAPEPLRVETLQPAESSLEPADWGQAVDAAPGWVVLFFLGDTLFALALAWTFLALRRALPDGPMAWIGVGAAFVKAAADVGENLLYLWPAIQAFSEGPQTWPPLGAYVSLATIKRAAAAVTGAAFAFALPGTSSAVSALRVLLFILGLAALLGFYIPALRLAHATLLFAFLAFLLWYRHRAAEDY